MDNKKHGYTLAEIMVVLLVLTIIFAAFAPVFTKRRQVASTSKYNVWQYHDRVQFNAFYNPGDKSLNGEAFIGITPEDKSAISTTFSPLSKLIIRSSKSVTSEAANQRHIQFRYRSATNPDKGDFAGIWYMDGKNVLMGGTYQNIDSISSEPAMNNTAIGYDALSNLKTSTYNTALGYNALNSVKTNTAKSNTAIGYNAGMKNNSTGNTFIGYYAGSNSTGKENTYIGYGVSGAGSGDNNTFIGAFAGPTNQSTSKNTAIGYKALANLTDGEHNIAIGTYALNKLQKGINNTAIGYYACSELTNSSNKTCIGANSGPQRGTSSENYLKVLSSEDTEQRTYIGSRPKGYGGDAVLEIHNVNNFNSNQAGRSTTAAGDYSSTGFYYIENGSRSNTTTVINGNLIVRGRPYFTVGSQLYHFHDRNTPTGSPKYRLYGYGGTGSGKYFATCANNSSSYDFGASCVNLYPMNYSDRRLKDIGEKSTIGMEDLRKINVYNFTFKNDKDKKPQVGVIAQELQKVFPNSVVKGEDGYLRIKWDEMFYAAINAVKELDKRLVALVKRTTNVETQISKLERENSSLKAQVESLTTRVNKLKAQ